MEQVQVSIQNPNFNLAISLIWALLVWGIPLVLLAVGAAAPWQPQGRHRAAIYFVGLLLLPIGAGYTLLTRISFDMFRNFVRKFALFPTIAAILIWL
jgi:hypothetical protein